MKCVQRAGRGSAGTGNVPEVLRFPLRAYHSSALKLPYIFVFNFYREKSMKPDDLVKLKHAVKVHPGARVL